IDPGSAGLAHTSLISKLHVRTRDFSLARGISLVDAPGLGVPPHAGSHRHQGPFAEMEPIPDRRIDSEERIRSDSAVAAQDNLRPTAQVSIAGTMGSGGFPPPEQDFTPDPREGLDRVVFENEAILADRRVGEDGDPAADITDKAFPASLALPVDSLAD